MVWSWRFSFYAGDFWNIRWNTCLYFTSSYKTIVFKYNGLQFFLFYILVTFFAISVYVADICEKEIFKKEDPQAVVIDEVLGFLTTLFLINPVGMKDTFIAMGLAFILFRFFDITKIGPIYKSQILEIGVGVVLD